MTETALNIYIEIPLKHLLRLYYLIRQFPLFDKAWIQSNDREFQRLRCHE
jgi:hypothetical protein